MGYIESLLKVRLGALLLMGALSAVTTGLGGKALKQLQDNKVFVKDMAKMSGLPGALHANDVVAALAVTLTAAGCGFIVACYSEWQLHRERVNGTAPWGARFLNEALLVFVALFMLGGAIASTIIVMHRDAQVTGVPKALQDAIMKAYNKSVHYRDYFCYYAMILAWVTFASFIAVIILVIMAGLYYRKQENLRRSQHVYEEKPGQTHIDA